MTLPDMSPGAVTWRLREVSARSDLTATRRLATKVDMSPAAVTRRLRTQSGLRDACLAWGRRPRAPGRVYVALVDDGVGAWRPVDAEHVRDDEYVLAGSVPEGEVWEFQPGEMVHCRERTFADGSAALVAFARVEGTV